MVRLIDADAICYTTAPIVPTTQGEQEHYVTIAFKKDIDEVPTVDAEPVRHGKWLKAYLDHEAFGKRPSIFYCSACCACSTVKTNYCPNCGARMDEE